VLQLIPIPRRTTGYGLQRLATLTVNPSRHRWISAFLIAVALISLAGCQMLGKSQNQVNNGAVNANPTSLSFGNVTVGSTSSKSETLTNAGPGTVTISQANVTGAGFSVTGLTLPTVLSANQSVTVTVKFAPAAAGAGSGNLAIVSDASNSPLNIPASATGVTAGTLAANPTSLSFGSVQVGTSTTLSETLTNTGGSNVTISQANVTGAAFSVTGLTLPTTLTPNQTVTFTAKFSPTAASAVTGNVVIVSDASNSPLNISTSGTGLASGSLNANPSSANFGNVVLGKSKTAPVTVTNSGGVSVTISKVVATGSGFSFTGPSLPITINPGLSSTFNATFTPSASGSSSGALTISSNANNPTLAVPLQGTAVTQGQLTPSPTSLSFGNVVVGSNKSLTETLTNSGGSSLTISAASVSGSGFSLVGLTLPLTLNASQSTTFSLKFAPASAGAASGNITITSDGANPSFNIPVSGTGVTPGVLSATPTSLSFGTVQVGSNASLSEKLTNTGGANVTISQANVTGSGFSITGLTLPTTLAPSQSVTFTAKFAPASAGAVTGNVAIVSDASNSTLNIPTSGTGVAPGQLTPNPASLSFGNVQVGNSKSLSDTLTNSGGSSVTISAASVSGSGFSISGLSLPLALNPGQTTTFSVKFAPASAGAASGKVTITSNGSNSTLNIPVSGTGVTPGTLSSNPTSLSFGNVQLGSSANLSETLTNTGGTTVTISQANATGNGFSITGLTLPTTLTPSQSVTFTVTFAPSAAGAASGNLAISSDASNPTLNIPTSGTGTAQGQLSVSPGTLSFGNVIVGVSSALTGNLNATGASVTVTSASVNSSEFVLSGISFPKVVAAGGSASFTVTFTPKATGTANANLTFLSNALNSPTIEALTGNGQAPPPHSVDLSWNSSTGAVSYNIYRKLPTDANYAQINSGDANTVYTDNNVTAGQTYDYVVTAVDSNNAESGYSNMAQVVIPKP
jgi:Abnormal spindle-like microcephaly-assoc'd, ASPM-SPD-2-Hydin